MIQTLISKDTDLRRVVDGLTASDALQVGTLMVENVLFLCEDARVEKSLRLARDPEVDVEDRDTANKALKRALVDSRTRCGANGDWNEQAEHFVIRAVVYLLIPQVLPTTGNPLWQAIQSCRMARSCALVAADDVSENPEAETQFQIINDYLANR